MHASLPVDPRWEPGAGNPLAGICPGGGPQGPSLPGRLPRPLLHPPSADCMVPHVLHFPMPRLIFVHRFFHPDHSASSQILSDLAFHVAEAGFDVQVLTSRQIYDDPSRVLPARESVRGVESGSDESVSSTQWSERLRPFHVDGLGLRLHLGKGASEGDLGEDRCGLIDHDLQERGRIRILPQLRERVRDG